MQKFPLCKSKTLSLVSLVTNYGNGHMCLSISVPNFLCQKPFAHGTESCIEITFFLKSFTVFIFLLQNGGRSDNSVPTASQPSTLCTNV